MQNSKNAFSNKHIIIDIKKKKKPLQRSKNEKLIFRETENKKVSDSLLSAFVDI